MKRTDAYRGDRPVRSVFYSDLRGNTVEKVNRGKYSETAVPRAVAHMQINNYGALLCEVYDDTSGVLHAVIRRFLDKNSISIIYEREVKEGR